MKTGTAFTLALTGLLASLSGAHACTQWSAAGLYRIKQSNGFNVTLTVFQDAGQLHGRARYPGGVGDFTGELVGRNFSFSIDWGGSSKGEYVGIVDATGRIIGGKTYDSKNPGSAATWTASQPLLCLVP